MTEITYVSEIPVEHLQELFQRVRELPIQSNEFTITQFAEANDLPDSTARRWLKKMERDGLVTKRMGTGIQDGHPCVCYKEVKITAPAID